MTRPEPEAGRSGRGWREAALGGALVALGGALFGAARRTAGGAGAGTAAETPPGPKPRRPAEPGGNDGDRKPGSASRPTVGRSKVRTRPGAPEAPATTRHWPPPEPPEVDDDGVRSPEQAVKTAHRPVDGAAVKRGYEAGDARPGTIVKVMLGSAFAVVCCIAGLFYLIGSQRRADVRGLPLTQQQLAVIVPPGPHLQDHPLHDIAVENAREFDRLKGYAWADAEHRTARIPIARAQALVVGRPLDPPSAPAAAPTPAQNP